MISHQQILGIDDSHLVDLEDDHRLFSPVAHAFEQMRDAAKQNNININICSSYRSFDRQLMIWNKKWTGQLPIFDGNGNQLSHQLLSDQEKVHAIMRWSALPGASRHHWGSDFDVYDRASVESSGIKFQLVPEEYEGNGPCGTMNRWISNNAQRFGFYRPYNSYKGGVAEEPWHLSHQISAQEIERKFPFDSLRNYLDNSDIEGKSTILAQLPELYRRYTLNQGVV